MNDAEVLGRAGGGAHTKVSRERDATRRNMKRRERRKADKRERERERGEPTNANVRCQRKNVCVQRKLILRGGAFSFGFRILLSNNDVVYL